MFGSMMMSRGNKKLKLASGVLRMHYPLKVNGNDIVGGGEELTPFSFDDTSGINTTNVHATIQPPNIDSAITLSVWVNRSSTKYCNLFLQASNDGEYMRMYFTGTNVYTGGGTSTSVGLNTWHHLVLTFNEISNEGKVYKNGVFMLTKPDITKPLEPYTRLGLWSDDDSTIRVGDIRVYDGELTTDDITTLFNFEKERYGL